MWAKLSHLILRYKISILIVTLGLTAFMGWQAYTKLELSYTYARVLPKDDPMYVAYEGFKARYGEDGNVMVIAYQDPGIFKLQQYQAWYDLTESIRKIDGVQEVMSTARLYNMERNDDSLRFDIRQVVQQRPTSQEEVDSLKNEIDRLPFYDGMLINKKSSVTLMAITFKQKDLNSKKRLDIVKSVRENTEKFEKTTGVTAHYSGMPWIRSEYMRKIGGETAFFLFLSLGVTAVILFIFFRYFNAVFFSLVVVVVGLIWSLGTIGLLGYKITVLTGLIPSLIVIIGIPNCIFLINKYQEELSRHGNKTKALSRMVQKVGLSNLLANVTTAIGFGVFYFTNSSLLVEFGVTAAINVLTTYVIAIVLTPIIFYYLPAPKAKQMNHLSGKRVNKIIDYVDHLVHNKRKQIYIGITVATLISLVGFKFISVVGYVVDDLPKDEPVYLDLKFMEKHFNGILPFEVAIDTKKKNGLFENDGDVLYRIDSLQRVIMSKPGFSKPLSIVEALKFSYQAYKDGRPKAYRLPSNGADLKALADYSKTVSGQQQKLNNFIDSTRQYTRVSFQMADVGSDSAKKIVAQIQPIVDSIFPPSQYKVDMTGHSLMFLRSFDYLLHHLFVSLLIAIVLILLIGMVLFRSVAIIVLSKLPCLIPLVMTAGIMGFMGVPFKSSTILIFSIAFGIASDGTIYILTEYRNQLRKLSAAQKHKAVSFAIRETALSMIYTNVILFFGFAIFVLSGFGGTVALGVLLSITLIVSLATNLILLPCILLSLERRNAHKAMIKEPLIDIYDEEEDVDPDKLVIHSDQHNQY
ncbi:MAG: MMPL family transporter [Bacteroidetes bacterium]|nr:MMPL family transporter [Bacteroidota bacterium]